MFLTETDEFFTYLSLLIWIMVTFIGFCLEVFSFEMLLKDSWDEAWHENQWRLVQFIYPIGALVAVGLAASRNYLAILVLIHCLWKVRSACMSYNMEILRFLLYWQILVSILCCTVWLRWDYWQCFLRSLIQVLHK